MRVFSFLIVFCAYLLPTALSDEFCYYTNDQGMMVTLPEGKESAPDKVKNLKCFKSSNLHKIKERDVSDLAPPKSVLETGRLRKPEDIGLSGIVRRKEFVSPLGKVVLRWELESENVFGSGISRIISDSLRTVSKTLRRASIPLSKRPAAWNIVVSKKMFPAQHVPDRQISRCHPAWMTPPGNIYIVAERVAYLCSEKERKKTTQKKALKRLMQTLLHEFGHVVEYNLLGPEFRRDPARAEGFASWFEYYSSRASTLSSNEIRLEHLKRAREAIGSGITIAPFTGSAHQYSLSALRFFAIEKEKGAGAILRVYKRIASENLSFRDALNKETYWDSNRLHQESIQLLSTVKH